MRDGTSSRARRARQVLSWGVLLVVSILAGGLGFAYTYYTDSATLTALIQKGAARYLPGVRLDIGRVRVRPLIGEVRVTQIALRQTLDGTSFLTVRVPWLQLRNDPRALLNGRFEPREVVVAQPALRLRRRGDGSWNLQGLLADPWPGTAIETPPRIVIQNGTVELCEDGDDGQPTALDVLRDVSVTVGPGAPGGTALPFEGTAKGGAFDRLELSGTIDIATGRVELKGDLGRLVLSEAVPRQVPAELRPRLNAIGISGGELDLKVEHLIFDPKASPRIQYAASGRLRSALWNCKRLPFPINDFGASFAVKDGVLTVDRAEGDNGTTTVRAHGRIGLDDCARAPLALRVDVIDLELNDRLRKWTPAEFADLWTEFEPHGRLSAFIDLTRDRVGGPIAAKARVECLDVGMTYKYFKYPIDHVRGEFVWTPKRVTLDVRTIVGGRPLQASGVIDDPGPTDSVVALDFRGEALPIDQALLDALPPAIRKVVDDFKPTGSVRGAAHLLRTPPKTPTDPPEGVIAIDAVLDLNERCTMTWSGLPYPIGDLTGRLELHPDRWIFSNMRGRHGQAVITGAGKVVNVGRDARGTDLLRIDLGLKGGNLPFDDELRRALPPAWRKTWALLNPIGACDLDAVIGVAPGRPDHYHLDIAPRPATSVRLKFRRGARPALDPDGDVELRMEDVTGRFVFDDGKVAMHQVGFQFHGAPVQFNYGRVMVEDSGRFDLGVNELWAKDVRLDRLRAIMPPVMAQFARRIDDGHSFTVKGDLGINWTGRANQPATCSWSNALVVFKDNTVQAGIPLEHLQGQLDHVRGWSNGQALEAHGAVNLASVSLLGQQITRLETPFHVERGVARLDNIRGDLLGGEITGGFQVSLDTEPRYGAALRVRDADLQRYARTIPGHQSFRGQVSAGIEFNGIGNDPHTLQGRGEAHITRGDLGELPGVLPLVKLVKLSPATKTAFDSADVALTIRDGESTLDPIKFTGDAFSLLGTGALNVQGALDLRLRVLFGRDRLHLAFISDALREASGQLFIVRVQGTPAYPTFKLEALPQATDTVKSFVKRQTSRAAGALP